jgi:hypothetical protein
VRLSLRSFRETRITGQRAISKRSTSWPITFQGGEPTIAPNATYWVGYQINGGQDFGAQFAQAKPEGAALDGTQNGSITSYNHNIYLEVETQKITYSFTAQNITAQGASPQYLSFMLCGGGLT